MSQKLIVRKIIIILLSRKLNVGLKIPKLESKIVSREAHGSCQSRLNFTVRTVRTGTDRHTHTHTNRHTDTNRLQYTSLAHAHRGIIIASYYNANFWISETLLSKSMFFTHFCQEQKKLLIGMTFLFKVCQHVHNIQGVTINPVDQTFREASKQELPLHPQTKTMCV